MITPRWRKILTDLWGNKARTLLVALSIAVGVFAIGVVSTAYFIISTDVKADFLASNPHDAMIFSDLFDDDLLVALKQVPGVDQIRGVGSLGGQTTIPGNQKVGIQIYLVPRLDEIQVDKIFLLNGSERLKEKEIYIDQGSFAALGIKEGDSIEVDLGHNKIRQLRVVGLVHDAYTNGFSNSRTISAYASSETVEWLGGSKLYNEVVFTTKDGPKSEAYAKEVAERVSDKIVKSGRESYGSLVYPPGDHPGQTTINTVLMLLGGMGALIVFLSTFLVINTISALLNQQIRQIGVMKAVGATAWQVMGMYMVLILLFGVLALILSMPASVVLGYMLAKLIVDLLNSGMGPMRLPQPSLILMVIIGLGVPLFAGLVPVINGSRLTVREAISNYGLSTGGKRSFFDRMLETVRGLPRPLLLSLRNTFRRKARLVLTLFTLILAGAIFMAVYNVRDAMYRSIEITYGYLLSDVNTTFNRPYRLERIHNLIDDIPGIVAVEGWGEANAQVLKPDGKTLNEVQIFAPPAGSQMIKPVLTAGRWLIANDDNAVVVGNAFTKIRPDVQVGDTIKIRINNKDYPFQVVGIYQIAGTFLKPPLYMNAETLARMRNQVGLVSTIRVQTDVHDLATQKRVADAIEARMRDEGIQSGGTITGTEIAAQTRVTIDIMIYVLLFMVVLIAVVGGLGLMGTMTMNVMERTREIGVMRSIGAVDSAIFQLVLVEGMLIGVISWGLGALLSIPITHGLDDMLGVSLLNLPLPYSFSVNGLITWLVLVLILAVVSCILPARNAVRLTVRDVLAYE